jgi:hypothetical protein
LFKNASYFKSPLQYHPQFVQYNISTNYVVGICGHRGKMLLIGEQNFKLDKALLSGSLLHWRLVNH